MSRPATTFAGDLNLPLRGLRKIFGVLGLSLVTLAGAGAATREVQVAVLQSPTLPGATAVSQEAIAIGALNEALAREICQRVAVRCTSHSLPFAEIIPGVESGRYQIGIGNVLRTPDRERRLLFSLPLWRSSSRLVGTATAIGRFGGHVQLPDLRGVTLAVERGTQQHRYLQEIVGTQKLKLIETASVGESMNLLVQGKADFSLMPVRTAYFLLQDAGGNAAVGFAGPALADHGLGGSVHVILNKNEADLRQQVDEALNAMRSDGTFQRILRRYMPFFAD